MWALFHKNDDIQVVLQIRDQNEIPKFRGSGLGATFNSQVPSVNSRFFGSSPAVHIYYLLRNLIEKKVLLKSIIKLNTIFLWFLFTQFVNWSMELSSHERTVKNCTQSTIYQLNPSFLIFAFHLFELHTGFSCWLNEISFSFTRC